MGSKYFWAGARDQRLRVGSTRQPHSALTPEFEDSAIGSSPAIVGGAAYESFGRGLSARSLSARGLSARSLSARSLRDLGWRATSNAGSNAVVRPHSRLRRGCKSLLVVFIVLGMLAADITAAAAEWITPIQAPVVDSFRPPTTRFGAGNRGLEFGSSEGLPVVSVDDGRVTFAGRIGSHRFVVVDHGQGLRSTYAYLASVRVIRGQSVSQGAHIGVAAAGFHLTARLGDVYVDPALLLAGAEVVVQLTENELPASRRGPATNAIGAPSVSGIRDWFADAAEIVVGGASKVVDGVERVAEGAEWVVDGAEAIAMEVGERIVGGAEWVAEEAVAVAEDLHQLGADLVDLGLANLPDLLTDPARAVEEWKHEECTDLSGGQAESSGQGSSAGAVAQEKANSDGPNWEPIEAGAEEALTRAPGAGHVLIQVGGLGSNDGDASIGELDAEALGYRTEDVVGFSYGGGCTPRPFGRGEPGEGSLTEQLSNAADDEVSGVGSETNAIVEPVGATTYGAMDTLQDLNLSAERLADLIEAAAAERPGQPIDVVAHSLGGIVTRLALEKLEVRRVQGTLQSGAMPNVVLTIGSPHSGVDQGFGPQTPGGWPVSPAERAIYPLWGTLGSVGQISTGSPTEIHPPGNPPDGVTVVAIAGNVDIIVPSVSAIWDEATNVIIWSSEDGSAMHSKLPSHPLVAAEFELALRGLPPRCVSLLDLLGPAVLGTGISEAEKRLATLFGMQRWLL